MAEQVFTSTEVPLERLEAEICEGAAHLFAGMARWLQKVAEFDRRRGHERWECRTAAAWLNWHCGISLRTAQEQVRAARALEELPAVAGAFARGELSYSKVRAITRVATPETEAQLLDWAPQGAALRAAMTLAKELLRKERSAERKDAEREDAERSGEKRSAERFSDDLSPEPLRPAVSNADALGLIVETFLAADHSKSISRHERTLVVVHMNADGTEAHLHDGPAIADETARRLACDGPVCAVLFGKGSEVLDLGRTQRLPTRAQRRALMARDGGCRFPGCRERRYVEAHHVLHWVNGGCTDLDNLVLLCWRHHHAVHEGGYRASLVSGALTVWRPDGTLLRSEALIAPPGPGIVERNDALGLKITAETIASQWDGSPANVPDCVEGLLALEDRYRREVESKLPPDPTSN